MSEESMREKIAREVQRGSLGFPSEKLPLTDSELATADRILSAISVYERERVKRLDELLRQWRSLVREGGVPRYTVIPGAALNTVVTWTDAALKDSV